MKVNNAFKDTLLRIPFKTGFESGAGAVKAVLVSI
jgi:hypothetical protein